MRKLKFGLVGSAVVACALNLSAQTVTTRNIMDANQGAMVFVTATTLLPSGIPDSTFGTAFLIHPDGYALTCDHVVPKLQGNGNEINYTGTIGGRYGQTYPITVIKRMPEYDLALIKLPRGSQPWPVSIPNTAHTIEIGDGVFVMGFPGGGNLDVVSGEIRRPRDDGKWVTTAGIDHGSSGGPVFDRSGSVIGIASGSDGVAQNVFIPISFVNSDLTNLPAVSPAWAQTPNVETVRLTQGEVVIDTVPALMRQEGSASLRGLALEQDLAHRGSLVLDGTHLILGPLGAKRVVNLRVYSLILKNNARIVTNGNDLHLVARKIVVEGGTILSFEESHQAAASGAPGQRGDDGLDAGNVKFEHVISIEGVLPIRLAGQDGGAGGEGVVGLTGMQGGRGSDAVPGLLDCRSGGGDGGPGQPGFKGGPGGPGGNGGRGGSLELVVDAGAAKSTSFEAPGGRPGTPGGGGAGGRGGPGGPGGNGRGLCGGGRPGPPGLDGPSGDQGTPGRPGAPGNLTVAAT